MSTTRKSYPSDVTDSEWEFLVSYLTLMREDAHQRAHSLRELFNALRYVVKTGCPWRFLPNDFPPWTAVYQQARRWIHGGVFEQIAHDLRSRNADTRKMTVSSMSARRNFRKWLPGRGLRQLGCEVDLESTPTVSEPEQFLAVWFVR